jgi:hypothetical protein
MPFDPDGRYRTHSDRSNDGFIDHAARRGVEKGMGFLGWCFLIFLGMMLLGGISLLLGKGSGPLAFIVFIYLVARLNGWNPKFNQRG